MMILASHILFSATFWHWHGFLRQWHLAKMNASVGIHHYIFIDLLLPPPPPPSCQTYAHQLRILTMRARNQISKKSVVSHLRKLKNSLGKSWMSSHMTAMMLWKKMSPFLPYRLGLAMRSRSQCPWQIYFTKVCWWAPLSQWSNYTGPSRNWLRLASPRQCTSFHTVSGWMSLKLLQSYL